MILEEKGIQIFETFHKGLTVFLTEKVHTLTITFGHFTGRLGLSLKQDSHCW